MKRTTRFLAILLCLVMLLSIPAFAAWTQYQGSSNHNGVITDAAPPTSTPTSINSILLAGNGTGGYTGVDTEPVMQKVGDTTYAYVLFDGRGTNGGMVAKINCNTASEVWRTTPYGTSTTTSLNAKSGFQLSTPYLHQGSNSSSEADDTLYVGVLSQYEDYVGGEWLTGTGSKLMKITGLDNTTPTVTTIISGISGQINTPIVSDGTYLYFGTYVSYSGAGTYYQVKISDETYKTFTTTGYGFYWAGANIVTISNTKYVVFGSDNGKLYVTPQGTNFGGSTTKTYSLDTLGGVTAGNVRSTISKHTYSGTEYIYFTSQKGYIWRIPTADLLTLSNNNTTAVVKLTSSNCTSAPVISSNGIIYVGNYGDGNYAYSGVDAIKVNNFTSSGLTHIVAGSGNYSSGVCKSVQASVIVYSTSTFDEDHERYVYTDNFFFTTNAVDGAGYGYSYVFYSNNSTPTITQLWTTYDSTTPGQNTYTLQGMAACNGYLTFGNDHDYFFIIH